MIFERKKVISAADRFIKDIHNLPSEIKDNTIILIGPMGTGKSTIAKLLVDKIENGQRLSIDNREQFKKLYIKERRYILDANIKRYFYNTNHKLIIKDLQVYIKHIKESKLQYKGKE